MHKKDVVGIVTGVCEDTFNINSKNSSNKAKYLKFHCQKVETTRNGKLRWLSGRFQILIWRPGEMGQNLESPGLSGTVDSPAEKTAGISWCYHCGFPEQWLQKFLTDDTSLPRSGYWRVISMEFLCSFLRCHFAGKPQWWYCKMSTAFSGY